MNFSANKYITEAYLEKRMEAGDAVAYVTSTGGLMWEKWQKEYRAVMDCSTWEEMTAFMKKVAPKNGVGIMAYSLSKRAMNYYTNKKAVELASRGIRVNAVLPGSTYTGMKQEFEKMAGGKEALLRENGTDDLSRAVLSGDREYDILGGHQAGVQTVGVLYGYGSRAELTAAGADFLAASPEELQSLLLG